jgi:hypothetical protein
VRDGHLITDFLSTLSATDLRSLIDRAAVSTEVHIMELQLQGFMVES